MMLMTLADRNIMLVTVLFVTFTLGPSVMKLAILPALGLLLPYILKL
jgi:hypothetical protein